MLLNFLKCKCLYTGHGSFYINYNMGDSILGTTVIQNDLVITINAVIIIIIVIIIISITVIQVSEQSCIAASKEGNTMFEMIRINTAYKKKTNNISVYMRAHTAFGSFLSSSDTLDARILLIPSSPGAILICVACLRRSLTL